jgi:predicted kinase
VKSGPATLLPEQKSPNCGRPNLIVLSGLPGTGKTSIARAAAARTGAFLLRIDAIETGITTSSLAVPTAEEAGYLAAYLLATENLKVGLSVIADAVNPIAVTRQAWVQVASESGAHLLNVEIVCSDPGLHRQRVESRLADLPGAAVPTWEAVQNRHFEAWTDARLIIDTASRTPESCADDVISALP